MRAVATQLLILVLTLGAAEVVLRVIDLRYLRLDESGVQPVYAHDAELGWFPIPNSAQTYTGSRTIQVHHNSIGFRDIEPEHTRKPTIAFVGDSFVWGYDSEEGERFTDLLRGMMPDNRIANLGVNAYGTDQEYLMLKRLWERFTPAVVVLMVCVDNDRIENSTNLRYDTMGGRLTRLKPRSGFCAETGAAASVLLSTYMGTPVSTTHAIAGAIAAWAASSA